MIKLKDLMKDQQGLGDTVEKITTSTGIKTVVEKTTQAMGIEDCGCSKRKEQLNQMFPYKK
jgi:hypothetical protein